MELTYHWEGDVLIPDLELEDGSNYQIGKYGRMRQRY
ncbi:TnpV protein, partial [Waltera sp.]